MRMEPWERSIRKYRGCVSITPPHTTRVMVRDGETPNLHLEKWREKVSGCHGVTTKRAHGGQVDGQRTCVFSGWNGLVFCCELASQGQKETAA